MNRQRPAPLPRVRKVVPAKSAFLLEVTWADGSRSRVDLTGLIHRSRHFGVFADNPAEFRNVRVIDFGSGIGWDNGLDYAAATLRTMAEQQAPMRAGVRRTGAERTAATIRRRLFDMEHPNGRLASAMAYAALIHGTQKRKGTSIPYVSHLMSVCALTMEFGGDEDQAIAGMLHDALEDVGPEHEGIIRTTYGERVAGMVRACTDGKPGEARNSANWRVRKESYLGHLAGADAASLLVGACDKLHNARAILADLRAGRDVFALFNGGRADTLWYYQSLVEVFARRLGPNAPVVGELAAAVEAMHRQARAGAEAS